MRRRNLFFTLIFIALGAVALSRLELVSPQRFLGFNVGEDKKLADWSQIVDYFTKLASGSDKVRVNRLGNTTDGKPFIAVTISSPDHLNQLDRYQAIQKRLADPRGLSEDEASRLIRDGKAVVLITCNIHSTEVASAQTALEFAYKMASEDSERVRQILDNVIVILVPSLNPDGQDMVVKWYRKYVGTPYEGSPPPFLYHKYVGHDNNRDWYMFTQVETQMTVEKIHNVWHPHIVYDVHQMGMYGARMFMPPWIDPVDPNIDPILVQEMNVVGTNMAMDLTSEGKKGVVTNAMFDLWTPSRHYQCYHAGLRILTESASARIATPVTIPFEKLRGGRGFDAKQSSWNFPDPWMGGEWHLRDIVDYQLTAFFSLLSTAARNRDRLLTNFYRIGKKAVERKDPPYAFVIPPDQRDTAAAAKMLNLLRFGMVDVHRATAPFAADGATYPKDTYVVLLAQPYGAFAKTLLERQTYPNLREYPGGPPKRPYDVTAHTLPLLMGVKTISVDHPFNAELEAVDRIVPRLEEPAGPSSAGFLMKYEATNEIIAVNELLRQGHKIYWLRHPLKDKGQEFPAGSLYLSNDPKSVDALGDVTKRLSVRAYAAGREPNGEAYELRPPRVALYKSYVPSMDEGWTRWIFEGFQMPYVSIYDKDITAGKLNERFDALVIPDMAANVVVEGYKARRFMEDGEEMEPANIPPEFQGGIGKEGVQKLRAFIEAGGTLVTLNRACEFPIEQLNIEVKDVLRKLPSKEFYGPGSILKVNVDTSHPIAYGLEKESIAWFERSPAFEIKNGFVVAKYPSKGNPLLSGWLLGENYLANKSAIVDVPMGKGRIVLLGFRVQYRGQSYSTYKFLFNSLYYAAARKVILGERGTR